jgi:hypothetical protein
MEAKLFKKNENLYILKYNFKDGGTTEEIGLLGKLSLKNCQAIEGGYNLDELGMDYASTIYDGRTELIKFNGSKVDFIKGFQKALELLGDKKFSEDDLMEAYSRGQTNSPIQSLQQTEWDVEIKMGGYKFNDDGEKIGFPSYELPKLDADGCLILKLKSE